MHDATLCGLDRITMSTTPHIDATADCATEPAGTPNASLASLSAPDREKMRERLTLVSHLRNKTAYVPADDILRLIDALDTAATERDFAATKLRGDHRKAYETGIAWFHERNGARDETDRLTRRLADVHAVLRAIQAHAGHPDPAEGCRLVIRAAREELEKARP